MHLRRLWTSAPLAGALLVFACNPAAVPEPTSSARTSQAPRAAETMTIGIYVPPEDGLGDFLGVTPTDLPLRSLDPNGNLWDVVVRRLVYSGIYRLDQAQVPVPDLAEELCPVSGDLLVITCQLGDVTFHDGTPLTADDVVLTYQLLISDACRLPICGSPDLDSLFGAAALDERTVEFRLSNPDPAFVQGILPEVLIEPRARVERAFEEFVAAADGADAAQLAAIASRLEGAATPVDCEPPDAALLGEAEAAISGIGLGVRTRDLYAVGPGGAFDACAFGAYLGRVLTDAADALSLTGVDAIAAAYRILKRPQVPIGSGPWRVSSIDPGLSMQLEAFDAFHHGRPVTPRVEVRLVRTTAEAIEQVRSGAVQWLLQPFTVGQNLIAAGLGGAPGVDWVEYHQNVFFGLHYNLRDGRLFADRNLRAAVERCVNKAETVAAATGGEGVPIYSPITPSMWAFEPDLPRPERDVDAAKELIEASGWTLGSDGIYHIGNQRLTATVPLWEELRGALSFVELLAIQVKDCGIEIVPQPMSLEDINVALTWPLRPPGGDKPWDAVFSGWLQTADPDPYYVFHSSQIATADYPDGFNFMGYSNAEGDALLEDARATYEPRDRARFYQEYQRILADDHPVLFAWSEVQRAPRSDRLGSTAGPLATDTSTWWWQLETLFIESPDP